MKLFWIYITTEKSQENDINREIIVLDGFLLRLNNGGSLEQSSINVVLYLTSHVEYVGL